ncbi:hypothetical protein M440DRAFT_215817 [Trichoderma longibrachiatum ATCC 18648]|uniref:Uncharacterized protein n=1 Tax=Trichoderma longibrachiatum ATCC 18648 TaxID=983965 RepID=A0A2T4BQD3_TRILO|nr:hypothetical protein M440DRAFT_215817 [Trichoderma longibrachiatum ATCC 18648]
MRIHVTLGNALQPAHGHPCLTLPSMLPYSCLSGGWLVPVPSRQTLCAACSGALFATMQTAGDLFDTSLRAR